MQIQTGEKKEKPEAINEWRNIMYADASTQGMRGHLKV